MAKKKRPRNIHAGLVAKQQQIRSRVSKQPQPVRTIKRLGAALDSSLRAGLLTVRDPGPSGTIDIFLRGDAICEVRTSGAESRALPSAAGFGVGQKLTVMLKTAGDVTITGSDDGSVVLTGEGDMAIFQVTPAGENKTDQVWRLVHESSLVGAVSDGDYGDITVSGGGTIWTIDAEAVTYAKIQDVSATDRILGRISSGAGDIEEITFTDQAQQLADDTSFAAMRATLGITTGSVDNAILRADGTGGATLQSSSLLISDSGWINLDGSTTGGATIDANDTLCVQPESGQVAIDVLNSDGSAGGFSVRPGGNGLNNIFVGGGGGSNSGTGCVFVGVTAGNANSSGSNNCFVGFRAGRDNSIGENNMFIGPSAGLVNTSGSSNVFIGNSAGITNSIGASNCFIGATAGQINTQGNNNVFIGRGAGDTNTTGGRNIAIGRDARLPAATSSFQLNIGDTLHGILAGGTDPRLTIRAGTTATQFRLYETHTSDSDYERFRLFFSSNVASLYTEAAGTGVVSNLALGRGTTEHICLSATETIVNDPGADLDTRIEGDTATQLFVCDAGLDAVQIGTTTAGVITDFRSSGIVFNEDGSDRDFRAEGDSLAYALFISGDAAAENIALVTTAEPNWQSMDRGVFVGDTSTAPTGDPSSGFFLYGNSGVPTFRTSGGVITPIDFGTVSSGTYTPTLTNVANLDASTAYECQYMRVGATVTVSGKVDVDPTAGASTQLGISLPIASNFGTAQDCGGTAFSPTIAGQGAAVLGDATNNRAQMEWIAVDLTNQPMYFTFTYQVI